MTKFIFARLSKFKIILVTLTLLFLFLVGTFFVNFEKNTYFNRHEPVTQKGHSKKTEANKKNNLLDQHIQDALVAPEFETFLRVESAALDKSKYHPDSTEQRLKLLSVELKEEEQLYLIRTLLEKQTEANLKIFSAYLLGLASSHNFKAIDYLLSQNLTTPEGPTHSPEETLSMQEKALRRMLIESLLDAWQKGDLNLSQIEASFQQIPDETLRQYALKRLAELGK